MTNPGGYVPPGSPPPGQIPEGFYAPGALPAQVDGFPPYPAAQQPGPADARPPAGDDQLSYPTRHDGYGSRSAHAYSAHEKQNGLGTAAMVLGIVAIVPGFFFIGIVLGTLGVIFGFVGRGRVRRGVADNDGQALAGIITGFVGIALAALVTVAIVISAHHTQQCQDRAQTQSQFNQCTQ